ncbi:MAG: 50S ribosome-binding GTPase [Firmicutes bacterium]|nr:50S ribosome-binding GTPase [Bacillota bacterium]
MPANLTPQYQEAEDAYKAAETNEAKLAALEKMLATIPKHKGTEKMQAELKRRLSKLKAQIAEERGRKAGKADPYRVEREGAAQVFVIGPVNTGKSSIVGWLTNANVTVAEYPFSTTSPISGMMHYQDVSIQLVDTPPVIPEEPVSNLFSNARLCDVVMVVLDLSDPESADHMEKMTGLLKDRKVLVEAPDASGAGLTADRIIVAANKVDMDPERENLEIIRELAPGFDYLACSSKTGEGMSDIPGLLFKKARLVRVYAKPPGGRLERRDPFVVRKGSTVADVAGVIHRQLQHSFKNARIWGSTKFSGQSVPRDYVVADGDIIEFSE